MTLRELVKQELNVNEAIDPTVLAQLQKYQEQEEKSFATKQQELANKKKLLAMLQQQAAQEQQAAQQQTQKTAQGTSPTQTQTAAGNNVKSMTAMATS